MGHQIETFTYKENVNRKAIEQELNNYVSHATWQEGGGGLSRSIKWMESLPIFQSEDDADEYINNHYVGDYQQVAVRFKEAKRMTPDSMPAFYKQAIAKESAARNKFDKLLHESYLSTLTSEFVSCKACGSKINRAKMIKKIFGRNPNHCPVCDADLRPKTKLDAIHRAKAKYEEAKEKTKEANRKLNEKGEVKWLVKIEYHT